MIIFICTQTMNYCEIILKKRDRSMFFDKRLFSQKMHFCEIKRRR